MDTLCLCAVPRTKADSDARRSSPACAGNCRRVSGVFESKQEGTLILAFDNSWGLISPRRVRYKVRKVLLADHLDRGETCRCVIRKKRALRFVITLYASRQLCANENFPSVVVGVADRRSSMRQRRDART